MVVKERTKELPLSLSHRQKGRGKKGPQRGSRVTEREKKTKKKNKKKKKHENRRLQAGKGRKGKGMGVERMEKKEGGKVTDGPWAGGGEGGKTTCLPEGEGGRKNHRRKAGRLIR